MPGPTRPVSKGRRLALGAAAVLVMYGVVELLLFAAISIRFGRVFTFSAFEASTRESGLGSDPFGLGDVPARVRVRKEVAHPYLGYVYDPAVEQSSPYGISANTPIQQRSPEKIVVGVFGGSFANDVAYETAEGGLAGALQPHFPGRQVVIVQATIGGYKQPQQLMALNYFQALGGQFDVVVNLDGFNEIALPALENLPHTNPFFPRQWHLRVRAVPDTDLLRAIGEVRFLDRMATRWAGVFRTGPLRYSVTANTIWRLGDELLYRAATDARARLPQIAQANEYAAAGPPVSYADDELYPALGRVWADSSYQMHAVAEAAGARYFHFLQPNQYLEGSKPMGAQERGVAVRESHPYAGGVRQGYPILRALGRDLIHRGVRFVDLTQVYAGTRAPLYSDNCCHVNPEGRRIVIAAIADAIAADLKSR